MPNQAKNQAEGLNSRQPEGLTKFINPRTDFSFKLLFGKEPNKDLMIDFLNGIFKGRKVITDLHYNNTEHKGGQKIDRRTVFDVYCTDQNGGKFIVEMQQPRQKYFKDRIIFYSANLIQEQGMSVNTDWDYKLPEVYLIALMDFCFDDSHPGQYIHHVRLIDVNTNTQFYNKLEYIFVELPKFTKKENELETKEENWLFTINNLDKLHEIPLSLRNIKEFKKLFEIAEVGKLNQKDMNAYQQSLKIRRDNYATDQYAKELAEEKGMAEGLAKGLSQGLSKGLAKGLSQGLSKGLAKGLSQGLSEGLAKGLSEGLTKGETKKALEIAARLKLKGMPIIEISDLTRLSAEQVEAL